MMTSDTSRTQIEVNQPESESSLNQAGSSSLLSRIRSVLQARIVETITVSVLLSLGLTGTSAWNVWRIYQGLQTTVQKQFTLQELSGEIVHLDEVLTMSARMAASTGNSSWEGRYNQYVPKLDEAIKNLLKDIPKSAQSNPEQTDAANQKLVAYETQAFDLVRQGKAPQALQLLLGNGYQQQKKIYSDGIQGTIATVKGNVEAQLQVYRQSLIQSVTFAIVSLLLLALTWSVVLVTVRGYIRDRQASQAALQESEQNLLAVNKNLQTEAEIRKQQEEQIRRESELLQSDVAHILDVVCALEEGDLRIQAEVNDRATGLVSDTLNRLIESLDRIVSVVVSTTQEVNQSAEELERVAVETAAQANYQTASVREVESLMNNVNALTADSLQQAIATDKAVQLAKSAVTTGQQEMKAMVGGIETLQQGTDQIVKRSQLLNDFVGLAAQFSKDQKRVASLTRVLALNASTLSSRALKEQDPDQFASIANEFEAIARQVNNLATETNGSLVVLQQQTDRIQTVTSGLNEDVTEIGKLVQKFTTEVNKSRQAFDNIEAITEQVAQVGQKVSHSSEDIVKVVGQTLEAVQAIAAVAQTTETKANATREQINSMGNLAHTLLEMVEFFQLNNFSQIRSPQPTLPAAIDSQKSGFLPEHLQHGEAEQDSSVVRETYEMILTTAE